MKYRCLPLPFRYTYSNTVLKKIIRSRWFNILIKLAIATVLCIALYYDLTQKNNLQEMVLLFRAQLASSEVIWLCIAIALMPFNWLTETLKWHQILRRYEGQSLAKAYQAVLAGVSFSLFTPNRVGEYGGRILFISPENRWKAVIINLVGNFSQIVVLISFGLFGAFKLAFLFAPIDHYWLWAGLLAGIGGIALLCVAYF